MREKIEGNPFAGDMQDQPTPPDATEPAKMHYPAGEPQPPASLIWKTCSTLIQIRTAQISEEQRLTNDIAALVEERRQRRKQIEASTAALAAIGQDPAMSEAENAAVAENSQQYIHSLDIGL
jgi:hypothetical protein